MATLHSKYLNERGRNRFESGSISYRIVHKISKDSNRSHNMFVANFQNVARSYDLTLSEEEFRKFIAEGVKILENLDRES